MELHKEIHSDTPQAPETYFQIVKAAHFFFFVLSTSFSNEERIDRSSVEPYLEKNKKSSPLGERKKFHFQKKTWARSSIPTKDRAELSFLLLPKERVWKEKKKKTLQPILERGIPRKMRNGTIHKQIHKQINPTTKIRILLLLQNPKYNLNGIGHRGIFELSCSIHFSASLSFQSLFPLSPFASLLVSSLSDNRGGISQTIGEGS